MAGRIPIIVTQQSAYVWDVDDIATLRSEHHICGILSGTLPRLSQQNVFLGVPLVLMPEEVVYLVENDVAVLVDDSNAYPSLNPGSLQRWISEQRRQEREERRAKDHITGSTTSTQPIANHPRNPSSAHTPIVVPTSSTDLSWYQPAKDHCIYTSIESIAAAGIWNFPSNSLERARCNIFRDLHKRGYFVAGGIKFGGEYLVYPGDPLRYHSHFVASVHESTFRPMEVVGHGRLGTGTKKTHLICGWDDEEKRGLYLSIEWAGFG